MGATGERFSLDLEQIRSVLHEATKLRPPRNTDESRGLSIAALEDYLLQSAWHHAELEEARQWGRRVRDELLKNWERLQGYEALLPGKPTAKITEADINRAKGLASPELHDAGQEAKRLLEDIGRQIDRFEFEKEVCSRVYTMISGS